MSFDTAIFDLDGTLVDSAGICAKIFNAMLCQRGRPGTVRKAAIQSSLSLGGEVMIRAVFGSLSTNPAADLAEFRARYAALTTPLDSVYPGVENTLRELRRRGITIGLCTKKPEALTLKVLDELGLRHYFDAVTCGDTTPYPKPDKRHLLDLLDQLSSSPVDAVMIGDSIVDFDLAHNAGVRFAFATYGYDAGEVSRQQCPYQLRKMDEALALNWRSSQPVARDRSDAASGPSALVDRLSVEHLGAR